MNKPHPTNADRGHFASLTGHSGFALAVDSDELVWVCDLFATPQEDERVVQALVGLAIQQGANSLITYEHPLLADFFMQFGFQPTSIVQFPHLREAPPGWIPEACMSERDPARWPRFLFMMMTEPRQPEGLPALDAPPASRPDSTMDPGAPCARCGQPVAEKTFAFQVFGGYQCPHCGFIHACGTLALRPRGLQQEKAPGPPAPAPGEPPCPCGSGSAFAQCHGAE